VPVGNVGQCGMDHLLKNKMNRRKLGEPSGHRIALHQRAKGLDEGLFGLRAKTVKQRQNQEASEQDMAASDARPFQVATQETLRPEQLGAQGDPGGAPGPPHARVQLPPIGIKRVLGFDTPQEPLVLKLPKPCRHLRSHRTPQQPLHVSLRFDHRPTLSELVVGEKGHNELLIRERGPLSRNLEDRQRRAFTMRTAAIFPDGQGRRSDQENLSEIGRPLQSG